MNGRGDGWYEPAPGVVSVKLNPISGQVATKNEFKKDIYFKDDNLPWYIFE